jgi:protein SCO1/2
MTKTKLYKKFLLVVIGLALAGLIAYAQIKSENNPSTSSVVASNFGGPLDLTDHTGKPFTQDSFESGKHRLIYFGFTYCPAICPTELQRISTTLRELEGRGDSITPYFITVDPERDTVSTIHQYVELFHPRLIGLTGTLEQIEQAKKSYRIYAAKVQDESMSDYTMDHSSFIYFISPQNDLLRVFKADDSIEDITEIIKNYL